MGPQELPGAFVEPLGRAADGARCGPAAFDAREVHPHAVGKLVFASACMASRFSAPHEVASDPCR